MHTLEPRRDPSSTSPRVEDQQYPLLRQIISQHAARFPDRPALVFLENGETPAETLSYLQLHRRAEALARGLGARGLVGERALLLFPSGIDYVVTFLGCLYAGVVAVPIYPPRNNWHAQRVASIARNAGAKAALTSASLEHEIGKRLEEVGGADAASVIAIETLAATGEESLDGVLPNQVAYLQYTSGSTGAPKGVVVRQSDLVGNCILYARALNLREGDVLASWLPIFHDMGLVQGIVMPLTLAGTAVFMPPAAFIQKPVRWLRAISDYRAVFSGAPNFAYALCVQKISDEEATRLDLSCWQGALNAAEPISETTMRLFAERFAACGLPAGTLIGGFGLAEATLYVTCGRPGSGATVLHLDKTALAFDRMTLCDSRTPGAVPVVSSGVANADPEVRIVNPETGRTCAPGRIAEIWVAGSSVCREYWNLPDVSTETFAASLGATDPTRYMRTGDLGFVHDGELYVTGRLKDLIIVRGANHYPQDIERTVESVHPALRSGGWGAAFSLDGGDTGHLVVVQEVERTERRKIDVADVGRRVARAVAERHGIDVDTVVLVEPGGVPKTSSGKIQRKACQQLFCDGELREIGRWHAPRVTDDIGAEARVAVSSLPSDEIGALLRGIIGRLVGVSADSVPDDAPFTALGLDSVKIVECVAQLGEKLGLSVSPTAAFEYPTIKRLADHLAGRAGPSADLAVDRFEPIAIVGLDCRFPGADGVDAFWQLLESGTAAVGVLPAARVRLTGYAAAPGDAHRFGGFIEDVECFDASLFGISPREARSIDPQQRLLLETAWHALESANIAPDSLDCSPTGVFVGISSSDYFRLQRQAGAGDDAHSGTGSALSVAANRISYTLGLQGPSMAVDTACSSSLVAVHLACRSLASGECNTALAGAANLVLSADYGAIFSEAGMLSPTGRCRTFDDAADGYVRGEGCGVVVLKRLADALRDGDAVLAVIRGSAVNQDGHSNGLTAPNGLAQEQVIRAALKRAGFAPSTIGFVETHGTGTRLGDPIEVGALESVFRLGNEPTEPCRLGAVKTNIGHLESAAGIAGLIKTVLVLQHGRVPPNCGFEKLNRHIELAGSRLQMATNLAEWPNPGTHPRRAGVSSFGFGGTNAHIVLEAFAPLSAPARDDNADSALLLTLSANSTPQLQTLAARYAKTLHACESRAAAVETCRAANAGRARLRERLAVVGADPSELAERLNGFATGAEANAVGLVRGRATRGGRIAFLFTGQGSQYKGMGQRLYASEPAFRKAIDLYDEILRDQLAVPLREILFGSTPGLCDDTRYAQPALVAVELALVALWRHWGIEPEFVVGHSVGEYAAACAAGMLDPETTLRLVAERGRLMASAPGRGAMASLSAPAEAVLALLDRHGHQVELAAINASDLTVISGPESELDAALETAGQAGVAGKKLNVSHAFHSRLMAPILGAFRQAFDGVAFGKPNCPIIPTGGGVSANMNHADYWIEQLRTPVRFQAAIEELATRGADRYIEIGPSPTLIGLGRRSVRNGIWLPSLRPNAEADQVMRQSLGELFAAGEAPRLERLDDHLSIRKGAGPLYPFDRSAHWFEAPAARPPLQSAGAPEATAAPALLGRRIDVAIENIVCFETQLPAAGTAFLEDHRVGEKAVLPGAAYASLIIAAARQAGLHASGGPITLRQLTFDRQLDISASSARIQVVLDLGQGEPGRSMEARVLAHDSTGGGWHLHAACSVQLGTEGAEPLVFGNATALHSDDVETFYEYWQREGLGYGPRFRALTSLTHGATTAFAELALPAATDRGLFGQTLHPVLLDAVFQTVGSLLRDRPEWAGCLPLPVGIDELTVWDLPGTQLLVQARLRDETVGESQIFADLTASHPDGRTVSSVRGLRLARVRNQAAPTDQPQALSVGWDSEPLLAHSEDATGPWLVVDQVARAKDDFDDAVARHGLAVIAHGLCLDDLGAISGALRELIGHSVNGSAPGLLLRLQQDEPVSGLEAIDRSLRLCSQVQALLLMLGQMASLPPAFKVCVLTRNAAGPNPADPESVAHSGLAGMLRCAALELPRLVLQQIDLPGAPTDVDLEALVRLLRHSGESQAAVRRGFAYAPRLRFTGMPSIPDRRGQILPDASYLITGGTGGLGLRTAEWLADRGARHIVLAARQTAPNSVGMAAVGALRVRGITVEIARADVSDRAEVDQLMRHWEHSRPPLRGIVHAAGVIDDRPLSEIDPASWEHVAAAKARGAYLVVEAAQGMPLDFVIVFSSLASIVGSAGQCNYGAANALVDSLAANWRRRGIRATTINWGPWAHIGMARDAALSARLSGRGMAPMEPGAAIRALDRVLATGEAQAIVAAADWARFTSGLGVSPKPSVLHAFERTQVDDGARPLALPSSDHIAGLEQTLALDSIRQTLAGLICEVLRLDSVSVLGDARQLADTQLSSLGIDSLMAMELRNRVRNWIQVDLPAHLLIGGSSIGEVSELVYQKVLFGHLSNGDSVAPGSTSDEEEIVL